MCKYPRRLEEVLDILELEALVSSGPLLHLWLLRTKPPLEEQRDIIHVSSLTFYSFKAYSQFIFFPLIG